MSGFLSVLDPTPRLADSKSVARTRAGLGATLTKGSLLFVHALADDVVEIIVTGTDGSVREVAERLRDVRDRPSMVLPEARGTVAVRPRDDGFDTDRLRVVIEPDPLRISVLQRTEAGWLPLVEDRRGGAWTREPGVPDRFRHYQHLEPGARHYGLGDKSGPLDRSGRRLRCLQLNALGYDAERTDPLYKHAPFVLVEHEGGCAGLLYDTYGECTFDLGLEYSHYFGRYRHVEVPDEALRLVVIAGGRVRDVVPRLHDLTGRTLMPPRWALGFAFTSMHHADAEDAPAVITGFAREARRRELPISALHLGSGYALADSGQRLTFTWNRRRFPDPSAFFGELRALGFRTAANVKPVLHTNHPSYDHALAEGLFVHDGEGAPAVEPFWDGRGAQLDFTNPATRNWWRESLRAHILDAGFDAVWNDNNEAELTDTEAETASGSAVDVRPLHALHMARASFEEIGETDPRPHNITRAGPIGICAYAETWTGDNVTSWHTLKWNLRQGLSMSLSGFPLVGHDIGGFVGPSPGPELLVRWFQMMALHPRCVMNSWKPDTGVPNLPWMHEEVFEHVVAALALRYRFLPVLEREIRSAHERGEPVIAPVLYHCDDAEARADMDAFMLGRDVLALPVVEEGGREGRGWLPSDAEWVDVHSGERHAGGAFATVPAPLDRLCVLVRAGATLRLAREWPNEAPHEPTAYEERRF